MYVPALGHDFVTTEPVCELLSPKVQRSSVGLPIDRSVNVTDTPTSTRCAL
jgi:hypothetical protein